MIRCSLVVLFVLLPLSLTACGGGGEEATQPTAAAQPTSAATPTPMSTPTIVDNLFEFKDKGYSARFPEGWTPLPNFVPGPDFSIDAFFAPQDQEVETVQPNMAVTCETLPKDMTLKDYFDREVQIVKGVTKIDPETSSRKVSGQEALQLRFTRENVDAPLEKTEVMFVTERCGWNISLTAPFSNRDSYHEPFEQFVNSFQLLP
jgi:hypothetical protein